MLATPTPIPMQHVEPIRQFPDTFEKFPELVIDVQPKIQVELSTPSPPPVPLPSPSPLEELSTIDSLLITKRLRVKSVLFLRGKKNRFIVRTSEQKTVYTVEEENTWWVGYFCYDLRPLQLKVSNGNGEEIMRIDRPYACTARIFPCQLQRLNIFAPPGNVLGTVEQKWTVLKPLYVVRNNAGEVVFWLFGPYITISCFSDVTFTITRADGSLVGSTRKRWQGLTHALFFSPITDRFGVAFDLDLSVDEKALLMAATLLMHYMYYDA